MNNAKHSFWGRPAVAALILAGALAGASFSGTAEDGGQATGTLAVATFAGGCFWCMEPPFDKLDGVVSTTSGYTGGTVENPTYKSVSSGRTGHAEALQVVYDTSRLGYDDLLKVFWRNIDPTTPNRQFCDGGSQYRSAIFYHNDEQRQLAEASLKALEVSKPFDAPIVTELNAAAKFYPAEDYHQDYYRKNPVRYKFYSQGCGRANRLKELWGSAAG